MDQSRLVLVSEREVESGRKLYQWQLAHMERMLRPSN